MIDLDRLIQEITAQGTITYQYDALGRRTHMTANGQQAVTYGYDAASRLTQVAQGSQVVGLCYDNANRRTSLTYPNGTATAYSYDHASRVTAIMHNGPSGVIENLSYTYDAAGNRISLMRSNGTASLLPAAVQAAYDAANEQIQFNSAPPNLTYDANGNLQTQTDASGTTTYTSDARNRLVGVSGSGVSASFSYDALGRRISKTINGVTTLYLYDGNDIVQEIGGGAVGANYLRSLNIDEPFVRQAGTNEFYHADALGSTLALTNTGGTTSVSYSYEAFGKTTVTGTSTNPFQFTGRENDGTGLLYYRQRFYSPTVHRFITEDPVSFLGGINLYSYLLNNPVRYLDPLGLDVTISLYEGQDGNIFEHIGVNVNGKPPIGLTTDFPVGLHGFDVPGYFESPTAPILDQITIKTSPQQDAMMQSVIDNAVGGNRPIYNVFRNNCATFVQDVLRAGGLQVPNTIFPETLMDFLWQAYGQQPRLNPISGLPDVSSRQLVSRRR